MTSDNFSTKFSILLHNIFTTILTNTTLNGVNITGINVIKNILSIASKIIPTYIYQKLTKWIYVNFKSGNLKIPIDIIINASIIHNINNDIEIHNSLKKHIFLLDTCDKNKQSKPEEKIVSCKTKDEIIILF